MCIQLRLWGKILEPNHAREKKLANTQQEACKQIKWLFFQTKSNRISRIWFKRHFRQLTMCNWFFDLPPLFSTTFTCSASVKISLAFSTFETISLNSILILDGISAIFRELQLSTETRWYCWIFVGFRPYDWYSANLNRLICSDYNTYGKDHFSFGWLQNNWYEFVVWKRKRDRARAAECVYWGCFIVARSMCCCISFLASLLQFVHKLSALFCSPWEFIVILSTRTMWINLCTHIHCQ